jgi:hypothetical protein
MAETKMAEQSRQDPLEWNPVSLPFIQRRHMSFDSASQRGLSSSPRPALGTLGCNSAGLKPVVEQQG